ncbi:MAG: hypothetical protein ACREAM_13785 [Blastocatellia bacterium]
MSHKITYLEDDDYDLEDDLPAELDLGRLTVVGRGPKPEPVSDLVMVALAPDVAKVFTTSEAVNEALRTLIRALRGGAQIIIPSNETSTRIDHTP